MGSETKQIVRATGDNTFYNLLLLQPQSPVSNKKTLKTKSKLLNIRKHVFVILIQNKGWYGVCRIEETKLVCAISRKLIFG